MNKKARLLFVGWLWIFTAPLFMDWVLNEQHEDLTFSRTIREVEAVIPHGKTVGTAVLTGLWGILMYHFHWQNQVRGQRW